MANPLAASGIDRLDRARDALGALDDLVTQAATIPQGRSHLQFVEAGRFCTLLGLILDEFDAARNLLDAEDSAKSA